MSDILIRHLERDSFNEAEDFLFSSRWEEIHSNGIILLASCNAESCGALAAIEEEQSLLVLSLYVEESCRRKGIGSLLLEKAAEYARSRQLDCLALEYSCRPEEGLAIDRFLLRNGFMLPRAGETLYFLSLSSLSNSYFASLPEMTERREGQIIPLSKMSFNEIKEAMTDTRWEDTEYLLPHNAVGRVLPDISFFYIKQEEIWSFVIMSEVDGSLHLNSAYMKDAATGTILIMLLQIITKMVREKYPHYDTMTVTAISDGGQGLIENLLSGAEVDSKTAYTALKPLALRAAAVPEGYDGVMVRLQALTDCLVQEGIGSALVTLPGAMPYMELSIEGRDTPLTVYYEIVESEYDSYEGFRMITELKLPTGGLDEKSRQELINKINHSNTPCYGICSNEGDVLVRATALEEGAFPGRKVVEDFLLPVMEVLKNNKMWE